MVTRLEPRECKAYIDRTVTEGIKAGLIALLMAFLMANTSQAVAPVSPPGSRFVWEPGENLTFTWTNENFDGFYDAKSKTGKESLTIKIDNLKDGHIPKNGITYFKIPGQTTTHYSFSIKYAVLESRNEKYLLEYPEEKNDIRRFGDNPIRFHRILIDDNTSHKIENGSLLPLFNGHDIEVRDVNLSDASVLLSLKMDGIDVYARDLDVGEDFIYEAKDGQIIAANVDSVIAGGEENSVLLNGIFQTSERFTKNLNGDIFGLMAITDVSDTGITMENTAGIVELKPGRIIDIGVENLRLKVADSNKLRVILYCDPFITKNETRGAVHTDLNRLMTWDGLNYGGFMYDITSGNNSESLEITNITGRKIPKGSLIYTSYMDRFTYTNYMASVPYAVNKINDTKPPGKDWSYVSSSLGGKRYIVKNNIPGIFEGHGVTNYEMKVLSTGLYEIEGEKWELGEGYILTIPSVNYSGDSRKARFVLKRNGVVLDDVWLKVKDVYSYILTDEDEMPKFITYIDALFSGTFDMVQLRNTWFVSDNVTQIKEGKMLGVFNVTLIEPDMIILTNREPIELKAGSVIDLFGNLSFFVENSDELRFYPTDMGGTQIIRKEVTEDEAPEIPDDTIPVGTSPVSGRTERAAGFEIIFSLAVFFAVYRIKVGRMNR